MKLGEIATVRSGLVLSRKLARDNPVQRYRLINLRSITADGYIDLNETDVYDAKQTLPDEYLSQVGDIVIRLSAPYTAVLIDAESEGMVISSNFAIVKTDSKTLLPEYLYWLLNTPEVKHRMFENSSSNMLGAVKPKFFADYEITPLPIPEQQKIAAINALAKAESKLLRQLANAKEQYYEAILRNTFNEIKRSNQI
ncbi:MAG: restriction endonuclease subunit S [Ruminococcus sp.]|nr:restriction endonuclease subunit S [Ruminococcus sp.]